MTKAMHGRTIIFTGIPVSESPRSTLGMTAKAMHGRTIIFIGIPISESPRSTLGMTKTTR
jgi:hypothetical protein